MPASTLSPADLERARVERVIQREIDKRVAERSDAFVLHPNYGIDDLARRARRNFGDDSHGNPNRSQMKNFERVALSASAFSDVVNFIKSQAGRDTRTGREWRDGRLADDLLAQLNGVRSEAESHGGEVFGLLTKKNLDAFAFEGEPKKNTKRRVEQEILQRMRLAYVQRYATSLAAQYSYLASLDAAA